jgi:hypothetical protein
MSRERDAWVAEAMARTEVLAVFNFELFELSLFSLRYTMGRATYAASDVAEIIEKRWDSFTANQREQIVRECRLHLEDPDCDSGNRPYYERIASLPVEVTE